MSSRQQRIQEAFAAFDDGDLAAFESLFDPDARWLGIPGGNDGATAECPNRSSIVDVLRRHHANGRRFTTEEFIEQGDRIAVGVTIDNPAWSSPVKTFKVFTFQPGGEVVVRLNDCLDESYALQVLAA